jgi:hypothetical protein
MRGSEISLAWLTPGEEEALTTIEARGADQEARGEVAVEDLSFTIRPGNVTGFLGPDVAGKRRRTGSSPRRSRGTRPTWARRCRRSFGERETVKVTIPEALGEEHDTQPEVVDDCRVRHRAAALTAVLVRLISCR